MSQMWTAVAACGVILGLTGTAAIGPADVVLRHVTIVDVVAGRVAPGRDIVVRGTRIAEVRAASTSPEPAKATVEGAGKFVMPALVDTGASGADLLAGRAAQALLAWGVTAVDVPAAGAAARQRWQRDLDSGRAYGPRLRSRCASSRSMPAASSSTAPAAVHDALQRLVDRGQSPAAALRAFTRDNAIALCLESDGVIAAGRPADLLVLGGNPLDDIHHTRAIDAVVFRGELLSQAHLQLLRQRALTPPTPSTPAR